MATKAVMDIVDYATHFIYLYSTSGLNYTESDLATDIVSMLPNETITQTDIQNACQYIADAYSTIDKATLITEIKNKLTNKKTTKVSNVLLIAGIMLVGLLLFKGK